MQEVKFKVGDKVKVLRSKSILFGMEFVVAEVKSVQFDGFWIAAYYIGDKTWFHEHELELALQEKPKTRKVKLVLGDYLTLPDRIDTELSNGYELVGSPFVFPNHNLGLLMIKEE